ncbi:hypothetical protein PCASD_08932 [Puccinia coronata f. sp. avenae]|uniref:Fungal-type protein kinase domain-containing protein n=1 Tax=Puccinia coronata f. sp. avenae TaxID=200324 RepID=A0A2N5UN61_9BASI|nr:hypothetical protein PCASD_08932 [Puccinia coronata f. sp. avenae]
MARKINRYVLGFHFALILRHFHLVNTSPFAVDVGAEGFTHARLGDQSESDLHTFFHTLEPLEPHPEDAKFRLTTEFSVDSSDMSDEFFIAKLTSPSWNPFPYEFLDLPSLAKLHNSAQKTVGDSDAGEVNMPTKTTPPGSIRPYDRKLTNNGPAGEETQNDMHDRNENLNEVQATPPQIPEAHPREPNPQIGDKTQGKIIWGADFQNSQDKLKAMIGNSDFSGLFAVAGSWKSVRLSATYTNYQRTLGDTVKCLAEKATLPWTARRSKSSDLPIAVIPEFRGEEGAQKRRYILTLVKSDAKGTRSRRIKSMPLQNVIMKIVGLLITFHQIAKENGIWLKLLDANSEFTLEESLIDWLDKLIFRQTDNSLPMFGVVDSERPTDSELAEKYSDVQKYLSLILTSNQRPLDNEPYKICLTLLNAWYRHVAWELQKEPFHHNDPGSFWNILSHVKPSNEEINATIFKKLKAVSSFYS